MNFFENANRIKENIIKHRRYLHENPELSFSEINTCNYICNQLKALNINYDICANTGVVATIGKGENCVALRADIDALPIVEETGLAFESKNNGIMHACGHDFHISMLLGAAELLKSIETDINGIVKLIFQPGEEKIPGGAFIMINKGVLENPRPLAIFGQHVNPNEYVGILSFANGPVMASSDEFYWEIVGKGCHAAQPHLGNDAIISAAQLVIYLQSLLTKFKNPLYPGVLSITTIHGGKAPNIFPDTVNLMGTLRTFNSELRNKMHELIIEKSKKICELYNTECNLKIKNGYPPLINNSKTTEYIKQEAISIFGNNKVNEFEPKMWAEDFAYYAEKIPATFWYLGIRPDGMSEMPPLHNAKLSPDEAALPIGTALLAHSAYHFLKNYLMILK